MIGYVVVEFNQASHQPALPLGAYLFSEWGDAEDCARNERERAQQMHRGERYEVAEVRLCPDR